MKKECFRLNSYYQNEDEKRIKSIYNEIKKRSLKRNLFCCSEKEFITWYNNQKRICIYCNRLESECIKDDNGRISRLTIDRKDNKQGYIITNLVLCCFNCNNIKGARFTYEQMLELGKTLQKLYITKIKKENSD